jgi:TRAP-type mannitol/chloroaromatic compound transport system substrate-binding protein
MHRRNFLKAAGLSAAAAPITTPAIAQSSPPIQWRLTSMFPRNLDTIFGAADVFAKALYEATDGRFVIQTFAAGEIVGGLQAVDAIGNGTVEMGHVAPGGYVGKDPTFAFGMTVPFGMNARQTNAWLYHGGGMDLMNEFYAKHNIYALLGGNTGAQMGGFFRREIKTVDDLKGLKFRIGGLAGQVVAKLGVIPQQIAAGDIYSSLERGTIDAAEWVGPYDDEKLGLHKVAPYYYYPGFWEGGPALMFLFNRAKWEELPKAYKGAAVSAAALANVDMTAKYDARNPAGLRKLVASGAQLRAFSQDVLEASFKVANEVYEEISSKNEDFKKVYQSYREFRNEEYLWWQVAEYSYDNFMIRTRARG